MTEDEFLEQWRRERPAIEAWGGFVAEKLMAEIAPLVSPVRADIFIRMPVKLRIKKDNSLLNKAFYRGKNYDDPLRDITDKVGVRFVVLLEKDVNIVCKAIEMSDGWDLSKDRDYESERDRAPYAFLYQSKHYIVRCREDKILKGLRVEAGTPCEVQVRTLLQHAHSEVTHDTIYKPSVVKTAKMERAAAKAMALVEATNDYFEKLMELIEASVQPNRKLSDEMIALYRDLVGIEPEPTNAEGLLNDAYEPFADDQPVDTVRRFIGEKQFVISRVKERASSKLLFRQPSVQRG